MIQAIWKDYVVFEPQETEVLLQIKQGASLLYSGKVYGTMDDGCLSVINSICRDYFKVSLPTLAQGFYTQKIKQTFEWYIFSTSGVQLSSGSIEFVFDWSYNEEHDVLTDGACEPINGIADKRMPILFSKYNIGQVSVEHFPSENITYLGTGSSGAGVAAITHTSGDTSVAVDDGNSSYTYHYVDSCQTHALYYVNAYGGWDFLLMQSCKQVDNITRNQFQSHSVLPNVGVVDEKRTYENQIVRTWKLTTPFLTDDEASRMHHLLESPLVYLYDLVKEEMVKVNLDKKSYEQKTHRVDGMVSFDMTAEEAKTRIRR